MVVTANTPTLVLEPSKNGRVSNRNGYERSLTDLMTQVHTYLTSDEIEFVKGSYEYAFLAHDGQTRKSGEPYIVHPIIVAFRLAKLKMPADLIAAALLHDTVEDCGIEIDDIRNHFGNAVATLVDGVTKLKQIELKAIDGGSFRRRHAADREQQRIESLRKMFVTAGEDRRVLLIKLADRMHNIETLQYVSEEQQQRIARETMDIYAPLADRLGMNDWKWQLEDSAFRYLNRKEYRTISSLVNRKRREREQYTSRAVTTLVEAIESAEIVASITGRAKHLYSIARKKSRYEELGRTFDEIHDLIALRVITQNTGDCYNALGVVHGLWPMVDGTFDDYISKPKSNGYQSLHTTVRGPENTPVEVQIRSEEMHEIAEAGFAAHWAYKQGGNNIGNVDASDRTMTWLKDMVTIVDVSDDSHDFIESVDQEILSNDRIQVFTPAGDVVELPSGATPLDFAYRIHTELGHSTVGTVVNGKLVPLNTPLQPGDVIEIRKARAPRGPSLDWQDSEKRYLVTNSARAKVRQWFSRQARDTNMHQGRQQLRRVLDQLNRMGHEADSAEIAELMGYPSTDDLVADLGKTHQQPSVIVRTVVNAIDAQRPENLLQEQLAEGERAAARNKSNDLANGVVVMGLPGVQVNFPQCCTPVYGDDIAGYLTRGRGVSAHRTNCRNIRNTSDPDRLVEVAWGHIDGSYPARLRVDGSDRMGLIHDLCGVIRDEKMNLHRMTSGEDLGRASTRVDFTVYTSGLDQLARLFSKLEDIPGVASVRRIN